MREGLSTIQQTLTPEAAAVLSQSIAEAARRSHGQTTPLHVADNLLSSASGFLRQACLRSLPASSHPLQCRALELCFSVALGRLPTAQKPEPTGSEPPISNALMAALKRAQAHQRRGCPEQQQQPLLAVKVELEQLVISILDDPSVSRVMREASFSSPAVKAAIERSLNSSSAHHASTASVGFGGVAPRSLSNPGQLTTPAAQPGANRNMYLNPRLQQGAAGHIGNHKAGETPFPTVPLTNRNMNLSQRLQEDGSGRIGNRNTEETPVDRPQSPAVPLAANRNMYLNTRLQQQGATGPIGNPKVEDVKKVFDIMSRSKKRNPVLVGDSEPEAVTKELIRKIENKEFGNYVNLKNVHVISLEKGLLSDKNQISSKIEELGRVVEGRIRNEGVILDLGDLKWLVEQPAAVGFGGAQQQQKTHLMSEIGRAAVAEMTKLLTRFGGGVDGGSECNNNKLWLIATATCETYLRCQVYHGTMENDWDLQAVPIASRSPLPGMFPRIGTERFLSNPMESLMSTKAMQSPLQASTRLVSATLDPAQKPTSICPQCSWSCEKEVARLAAMENLFSESKQDPTRPSLPQWLQNAKLNSPDSKTTDESQREDKGLLSKQKTQELQNKWRDTCLHLHPNFHQTTRPNKTVPPHTMSMPSLYNPKVLARPPFQPKLLTTKPLEAALQSNTNQLTSQSAGLLAKSQPACLVQTDLVLGTKDPDIVPEKPAEDQVKDFLGCISSEPQSKLLEKFSNDFDADTYKKLLRGLMEKAWWQAEAATAIASAITRCRMGNGKRRGAGSRGDVWLLFTGPDRVGKKKMAFVLADQVCGTSPVIICLGLQREGEDLDTSFRGKTAVNRISEAIRRNPCSVIMLVDIDEADMLVRENIKRAMERGRLTDSHGREVGLGNAIFIVTGDWSTVNPEALKDGHFVDEKKLESTASGSWQLGLIVREKSAKRRADRSIDENKRSRPRRETVGSLSLDLNLAAGAYAEDDRQDVSHNSSDVTIEDEDGLSPVDGCFSVTSAPHELVSSVDDSVLFKPVDLVFVRREIKKTISVKFSMAVDESLAIEIGDDVLEKILGGLWHDRTSLAEWVENVVGPSFEELKARLPRGDRSNAVVRLVVESDSCDRGKSKGNAEWLPSSILV